MKNKLLSRFAALLLLMAPVLTFAQEDSTQTPVEKPVKKLIRNTFENAVEINNQTIDNPSHKTLDFMIQHRFGVIDDADDLFGLFAPSNIRLGLTYGITDRLALGAGVTKNNYLVDLQWKYQILKQTKGKGMPVSVAYYGDVARSAKDENNFYNQENKYVSSDRISYFHELMVARKVNQHISLQLGATYVHMNIVEKEMVHDNVGISFVGRYKVTPQGSVVVDFDYPIIKAKVNPAKPNLGVAYEIATSGHQFQIFFTTAESISNQYQRVYNQNSIGKLDFLLGFNITRQWSF